MRKEVGLMSVVFFVVSFITTKTVFAQTESDSSLSSAIYIIPPVQDTLDISKTGYYLSEIKDLRANKTNNGSITERSRKSRLTFKDSLPIFLSSFIFPKTGSSNEKQNAITLEIEKFKCFASTNGNIDEAELYIKVNFYDVNKAKSVHTFERTFNYQKKSKPDFVSQLIYSAFKTAFARLKYNDKVAIYNISEESADKSTSYYSTYKPAELETPQTKKAQNTYIIPIPKNKVVWENQNFYLANIKDTRIYNRNEGSVLAGIFNRRAEAKLDSSLKYYLANTVSSISDSGKKALTLNVHTFTCNEGLTALGERGTLFFSASLVIDSAGTNYTIYNKTLSVDSLNEVDITKSWPAIIAKTLNTFFENFAPNTPKTINDTTAFSKSSANEITVEQFYYKNRYFWNGTELKKLNDFDPSFEQSTQEAKQTFNTSKDLIRAGRIFTITGGVFLAYSAADFLLLENKSIKNWYKAEPEESSSIMPIDKRVFIWTGATSLITGFVFRTYGKSELLKAIGIHNKSVAGKVSLNFTPDFYNQGYSFQLNLLLGQR